MPTLKEAGYIQMAIPREKVMPLDLLYKTEKGVLERYNSPLYKLFVGSSPACPLISDDEDMPGNINSEQSLDLSAESGLSLLDYLTKLIKTKLLAEFSYNKQSNVVLKLNEPKSNYIDRMALDEFLQNAQLNKNAAGTVKLLFDNDLYVITEIIKSKSFTLEDKNAIEVRGKAELTIPQIVESESNLSKEKEQKSSVTYQGDKYLTFAVMASRLKYNKPGLFSGGKGMMELKKDGGIVLVRGKEESHTENLAPQDGFITL